MTNLSDTLFCRTQNRIEVDGSAYVRFHGLSGRFPQFKNNGWINGPTDEGTEKPSYRDAWTHLNKPNPLDTQT